MIREELGRLATWEERHRRLVARLMLVLTVTAIIEVLGATLLYFFERHAKGTEIRSLWDAFFFTTVQLLTVSSQLRNPFTTGGRIVDIVLEFWAVTALAGSAGAISSFFQSTDGEQ